MVFLTRRRVFGCKIQLIAGIVTGVVSRYVTGGFVCSNGSRKNPAGIVLKRSKTFRGRFHGWKLKDAGAKPTKH